MKQHKKKPTSYEKWKASDRDFWRRRKLWERVKGIDGCGSSSTEAKLRSVSPDGVIARFIRYHVCIKGEWIKTPYMYEEYDVEANLVHTEIQEGFEI